MKTKELRQILNNHQLWLDGQGGEQADFSNQTLSLINFGEVNQGEVNLRKARLIGADLRDTNLQDAILIDANLRAADLRGANLRGADLGFAILEGAKLHGANLHGASLYGTRLWDAEGIISIYVPGMSTRGDTLYAVAHGTVDSNGLRHNLWMIKAGCWWGTLAEFEKTVQEKERTAYIKAVAFIRSVTSQEE